MYLNCKQLYFIVYFVVVHIVSSEALTSWATVIEKIQNQMSEMSYYFRIQL
jgi:hypothetical protein